MPKGPRARAGPPSEEGSESQFDEMEMPEAMRQDIARRLKPQEYARFFQEALPDDKQRAVKGLQGIQSDIDNMIQEQCVAVEQLYRDFRVKLGPLYNRRAEIISGTSAPTDEEVSKAFGDEREGATAPAPEEKKDEAKDDEKDETVEMRKALARARAEKIAGGSGIPRFWLEALRNHDVFDARITERDEPILEHLVDVDYIYLQPPRLGFVLRFVFTPNDAMQLATPVRKGQQKAERNAGPCPASAAAGKRSFEAGPASEDELRAGLKVPEGAIVLFKTYYLESDMDGDPVLTAVDGTEITWKAGRDPSVEMHEKKQVRGGKGGKPKQSRVVKYEVPVASFFNFFKAVSEENEDEDEEEEESPLDRDFEMARLLRSTIIPRAIEYFTGRALEPEQMGFGGDDDDEEDEEGEDEEDDAPPKGGRKQKTPAFGAGAKDGDKKEECKQQ